MPKPKPYPTLKPMLASLTKEAFDDPQWLYEIKWDGYRIIATVQNGKATLTSRELKDYTAKYQLVADDVVGNYNYTNFGN